jgi:hypothetical protein
VTFCVSVWNLQNGSTMPVFDFVSDYLGHHYDERWLFTLSTFLIGLGFRLGAVLSLRYINHLKR